MNAFLSFQKPIAALVATTCLAIGSVLASQAQAHFQLVYTPEVNPAKAGDLPIRLIFWHPFDNGHAMDMGPLEDFYAIHRGEKIDLRDSLEPIRFKGPENEADAFSAVLPVRRSGDYVMVAVPTPYLEPTEDIYIQQITKSMVSRSGVPTDWADPVGLKAEILPLNRPTNILTGSTFSGQVLSDGAPVAGAEVEIEYIAAEPDPATNQAGQPTASPPFGGTLVAITDQNGVFTFGIPKAGFWGFAALGVGPDKSYDGKDLSQDAVLWIRAYDMETTP